MVAAVFYLTAFAKATVDKACRLPPAASTSPVLKPASAPESY
jgi:hypothetical protein